MLNPFAEVKWNPDRGERRKFAASLVIGFPCVAAALLVLQWLRGSESSFRVLFAVAAVGAGAGIILWIMPQIARPFYVAWYAIAACAGFVIGNALLTAIYLLMFVPLGLARRALGRETLSKGFDRAARTYWRDARPRVDIERYYRQF